MCVALRFEFQIRTGVNFINVLRTAFALVDPKNVKRYWGFDWILTLLGSMSVKAVHRMLMKFSPGVNFINVYLCIFCTKFWHQSWNITRKSCQKGPLCEKRVRLMLMKLTAVVNFINILLVCFCTKVLCEAFSSYASAL